MAAHGTFSQTTDAQEFDSLTARFAYRTRPTPQQLCLGVSGWKLIDVIVGQVAPMGDCR
jgi:hypothetical protein